jgi:hypothetical protein
VQFDKLTVRAAGFDVSVQPNVELVETQSNAQLLHVEFRDLAELLRPNTKTHR